MKSQIHSDVHFKLYVFLLTGQHLVKMLTVRKKSKKNSAKVENRWRKVDSDLTSCAEMALNLLPTFVWLMMHVNPTDVVLKKK